MIIGIASGKGGTGKTTVAVNLALLLARQNSVSLFDLDVEEPNANLFLKSPLEIVDEVSVLRPEINEALCTNCGLCAKLCEYNALAVLPNEVLVFPELCHSCGLCALACPTQAIKEIPRSLGTISKSRKKLMESLNVYQGTLNIGEALVTPIIRQMKEIVFGLDEEIILLDLPPGSSCPVVEGLRDIDYIVFVTEPTPAGEHDLKIAIEVARVLGVPFGVVINRADVGDERIDEFLAKKEYPLLAKIPHRKKIYQLYSDGKPLLNHADEFSFYFIHLWDNLLECV